MKNNVSLVSEHLYHQDGTVSKILSDSALIWYVEVEQAPNIRPVATIITVLIII